MGYITETSKTVKLSKAYLAENGVAVKGSKVYLVEDGKTSLLWRGGVAGTYILGGADSAIATSTDGVTWNLTTGSFVIDSSDTTHSDAIITDMAYGNGVLVAAVEGVVSTQRLYYSTNKGQSWTYTGVSGTSTTSYHIAFGNGKFVAVSKGTSNVATYYSTDGKTWTSQTTTKMGNIDSLTYANDKFLALYRDTGSYISSDGITWTRTYGVDTKFFYYATYIFGKYFLFNKYMVMYSTSAESWTWTEVVPSLDGLGQIYCGASNDSIVALAGYYSQNENAAWYMDTDDGTIKAGSGITLSASSSYQTMIYHDKFVFATVKSIVAYSIDGKAWTQQTLGSNVAYRALCFIPDEE